MSQLLERYENYLKFLEGWDLGSAPRPSQCDASTLSQAQVAKASKVGKT